MEIKYIIHQHNTQREVENKAFIVQVKDAVETKPVFGKIAVLDGLTDGELHWRVAPRASVRGKAARKGSTAEIYLPEGAQ